MGRRSGADVERELDDLKAPESLGLILLIETPAAVLNLPEMVKASPRTNVFSSGRTKGFVRQVDDLQRVLLVDDEQCCSTFTRPARRFGAISPRGRGRRSPHEVEVLNHRHNWMNIM